MAVTSRYHNQNQKGFILAATLWMLAIIFIMGGVFYTYVQKRVRIAIQVKKRADQRRP